MPFPQPPTAVDFTFPRESWESQPNYPVAVTTFENMAEQRRLETDKQTDVFNYNSPNFTNAQKNAFMAFYDGKKGSLTSFTIWDPIRETIRRVRFSGPPKVVFAEAVFRITASFTPCDESEL